MLYMLLKEMTVQPKLSKIIPTLFSNLFQENFNNVIGTSTFPDKLKCTDVKEVFN